MIGMIVMVCIMYGQSSYGMYGMRGIIKIYGRYSLC